MGTFKSKILIYSLLLGSFPTILIGFFSYFIAAKDVEEKVNEGNMHLLNQTRMRVEQVLDSMQRTALQFENSSLKSVMDSKLSGQDFIKVRELMKEMFNLQTQTILNQVYVVNLKHEWVVDLNSLKPLEGLNKTEFERYLDTNESIFWAGEKSRKPRIRWRRIIGTAPNKRQQPFGWCIKYRAVEECVADGYSDSANHRQRYPEYAGARQFAGRSVYPERAGRCIPVASSGS